MFITLTSKFKIIGLFLLSLLFTYFTFNTQANASNQHGYATDEHINGSLVHNIVARLQNKKLTELPFYWDSIDVAIEVEENGDILVTETQESALIAIIKYDRYL